MESVGAAEAEALAAEAERGKDLVAVLTAAAQRMPPLHPPHASHWPPHPSH